MDVQGDFRLMHRLSCCWIALLSVGLLAGDEAPAQTEIPAQVQQFVRENLKGCEVQSTRIELKTNAVLARLMSDLYKSRYEYHFEMKDARGESFRVRMQDFSKIERLDSCKLRVADLPDPVQKRLKELGPNVRWDEFCSAEKDNTQFIRYELKGRLAKERIRATLLHDGTVISYPGMKNERIEAESPEATSKFIESTLLAPKN
jgi:hypothetical protein